MKSTVRTLIFVISCFMYFGCGPSNKLSGISEGKIIYKVEFPKSENKSQLIGIMPDEVEMNFKNNNTALNIKGHRQRKQQILFSCKNYCGQIQARNRFQRHCLRL